VLDRHLDDADVLFDGEGGRLARRPDGHEAVDAARDLLVDEPPQRLLVDLVVAQGRHDRRDYA
jgi:hypothetical protein